MGWMSWQSFRCELRCDVVGWEDCISAHLFKTQADILAEEGYLEAGYNTIHIDDCWQEDKRSSVGSLLVPNATRFPQGITGLADYMHSKGMRLGLYTDIGVLTCGGYPGSRGYYEVDAKAFASWGVDYLKVDGCYERSINAFDDDYSSLGESLRATGRKIQYSCGWPAYLGDNETAKPYDEIVQSPCVTWRNWSDILDRWSRLLAIVNHWGEYGEFLSKAAGRGKYNDPDMLVIGTPGLSLNEQKLQLAVWSIVNAPLIMGNDLRSVPQDSKALLLNTEMIAINQDEHGIAGWRIKGSENSEHEVWARPLSGGDIAIALLNKLGETVQTVKFEFDDVAGAFPSVLGRGGALATRCADVRDVFEKRSLGKKCDKVEMTVGPHGAALLRLSSIKL